MPAFKISHRLLAITAFVGWMLFANIAIRVAPEAIKPLDSAVATVADGFVRSRIDAVRDAANWDRPISLSTDGARTALERQAAANPGALPELALTVEPTTRGIWAQDGQAMVETRFATNREGETVELLLLRFVDGAWLVSEVWRVVPNPTTPLVPAE